MGSFPRWTSVVACVAVLVGLGGCGNTKETRFYVLTALPATERPSDASSGPNPAIGLRPIGMPEQLDRPQIVTRVGENMLHLAEFDQWGAPLQENFTQVLAQNLGILVPTDRVVVFPWPTASPLDYEVAVDVAQFEGSLSGNCSLIAHWAVLRRGANTPPVTGTSNHREPAGDSYATLVAALSRDIATALKAAKQ